MKLYLIRHAESTDNCRHIYAGVRDSHLTERGILQAKALAMQFVDDQSVRRVYCSTLTRALQTVSVLTQICSEVDVIPTELLNEKDFGSLEGKSFSAKSLTENDGESESSIHNRLINFLSDLCSDLTTMADTDSVLIVSHGVAINQLLLILQRRFRFHQDWPMLGNAMFHMITLDFSQDRFFHAVVREHHHLVHLANVSRISGLVKYDPKQTRLDNFSAK
ncbi:histidine phosphatase superfamily [Lipomyces oligophaga]|uniref:histidine phosphatase superfamily n=1 Tax=Lipomyces oligophaga TaxID=45792 RepID=UPI0034CDB6BB